MRAATTAAAVGDGGVTLAHLVAHGVVLFRTGDGEYRRIENVTFPLFAHTEDFVGVIALAWLQEEDRR